MPQNAEREDLLRDAVVEAGFGKANTLEMTESEMLDWVAEDGQAVCPDQAEMWVSLNGYYTGIPEVAR
jgi:hypothetical protein